LEVYEVVREHDHYRYFDQTNRSAYMFTERDTKNLGSDWHHHANSIAGHCPGNTIQLQYNEVRTFPTWNWNPELIQSIQALQNIRLFSRVSTVSHRLKEFAPPAAAGTKLNDASTPLRPCRRRRCLAAGLFSFHSRNFRMGLTAH